jgi:hypothetical protein
MEMTSYGTAAEEWGTEMVWVRKRLRLLLPRGTSGLLPLWGL